MPKQQPSSNHNQPAKGTHSQPNWPSKTGNPSGGNRTNNPPKSK
ncbi:hypothetical protein [Pseudoalteromonas luteoviolacea]|uniref:Uncharacterized protein n=1 Tax=Pseudoalteromonas luteoviolacea H33 TaxID=1365251 RepID=A0A167FSN3_9GAMM|nr:hypothetical protein [Pseudoalteromonas luteoviolacea]KZN52933.1 hypothetical protein N476_09115 [Pseudoalteromonas luteoviolacea H33]KZN78150.1 hypothetical protein N477_10950 [Pseudoalteromonas luteoviolacea H33-S]